MKKKDTPEARREGQPPEQEEVKEQPRSDKNAKNNAADMILNPEQQMELREKFDKLQAERDEMVLTAQRVQAEFDNFRRRNASARTDALNDGAQDAIKALLPAYDSLQLAVQSAEDEKSPLAQGVALVFKQFDEALKKLGVETLDPIGEQFDPNFHNAIMREDATEGVEPNTITMVLQKGYLMNGKVIREVLVKVAV